ncbi:MAG: hypothetical protein AAF914_07250 [Pseudomonadota bacterium]
MTSTKRVVVKGGGKNLYRISEGSSTFYVQHAQGGLLSSNYRDIGKTRSLEDAITLIRSHSGQEIESID